MVGVSRGVIMDNEMKQLKLRVLYLEQELEKLQSYIRELDEKLAINPFTRDSFRDNYGNPI